MNIEILRRDVFAGFAHACLACSPRDLALVSPWVSSEGQVGALLGRLLAHLLRHQASVLLLTRAPMTASAARVIDLVAALPNTRIFFNDKLHAKVFVCEARDGTSFAVIGSANATQSSSGLHELAIMLRSNAGSRVIRDLGREATAYRGSRRYVPRRRAPFWIDERSRGGRN